MHAALCEPFGEFRRMHRLHGERRERRFLGVAELRLVRHHGALDRLGRMRRIPADHVRAKAALRQDVPQRLRATAGAGGRADAGAVGVWLGEAEHPMGVGALAGGDGVPEDRREDRTGGGEVARRATLEKPRERRHQPLREQRLDHLPVGCVPTDEEHAAREAGGDCSRGFRRGHDARVQRARTSGRAALRQSDDSGDHFERLRPRMRPRPDAPAARSPSAPGAGTAPVWIPAPEFS